MTSTERKLKFGAHRLHKQDLTVSLSWPDIQKCDKKKVCVPSEFLCSCRLCLLTALCLLPPRTTECGCTDVSHCKQGRTSIASVGYKAATVNFIISALSVHPLFWSRGRGTFIKRRGLSAGGIVAVCSFASRSLPTSPQVKPDEVNEHGQDHAEKKRLTAWPLDAKWFKAMMKTGSCSRAVATHLSPTVLQYLTRSRFHSRPLSLCSFLFSFALSLFSLFYPSAPISMTHCLASIL